jgi:hypothetical protein
MDQPLYQDFVSPQLCKELMHLGLTPDVPYHYRIFGSISELNTFAFDKDDYYQLSQGDIDFINNAKLNPFKTTEGFVKIADTQPVRFEKVPAYQVKDMEKLLPGNWLLQKNEKGYELLLERIYGIQEQVAFRLPDVFAQAVVFGLKKRIMKLQNVNLMITYQNTSHI